MFKYVDTYAFAYQTFPGIFKYVYTCSNMF